MNTAQWTNYDIRIDKCYTIMHVEYCTYYTVPRQNLTIPQSRVDRQNPTRISVRLSSIPVP